MVKNIVVAWGLVALGALAAGGDRRSGGPAGVPGPCAAALADGRVLVTGGSTPSTAADWAGGAAAAPMTFARSGHACAALADGRILVVGGITRGGAATNAAELYDPATDTWTIAGPAGWARAGHTATLLDDGRVLVAGGRSAAGAVGTSEWFDPVSQSFSPLFAATGCTVTYSGYARRIQFSGYEWAVKNHSSKVGPGPNLFSDSTSNAWVDEAGRLHLKITKRKGRWYCAEVISTCTLGYGTYRFYLDSAVDALNPNVVLGLFTWSDNAADNHRENDIEFARWADPNALNAQYVVQPYDLPGHIFRFQQPPGAPSTHSFLWNSGSIYFESSSAGGPIAQQTFTDGIPQTGGENARMNLWLFRGRGPTDGRDVEVIVNRFEFVPAP